MSLVVLDKVSLGFGRKQLVGDLDLRIAARDRIGLIGPNGSGKTSIMRMFSGEVQPDDGSVRTQKHLRIGYLPQDIPVLRGRSVLETLLRGVPGRAQLDSELAQAETDLSAATVAGDEDVLMDAAGRIADIHQAITTFEQYYSEHQAHRILAGLGFSDAHHDRDIGELSGGWKMRAVLATLLFSRPDLLLLDEPTNHLDLPSVSWLANFLRSYDQGFVLICHDREFLNEQITRVVSLEPEGVRQFRGNYDQYLRQRAEEEVVLESRAKNLAREREKSEQFVARFRSKASKAKSVQSRIRQLAKQDDVATFVRRRVMQFRFPPAQRAGGQVLKISALRQAYGEHVVFDGVDLSVSRGEKIGIIGVNGAGKTTLLRTVAGELTAAGGTIEFGHNVKMSYYAQHHADALDAKKTTFEEVAACNDDVGPTAVRTMLGAFLFSDEDVDKSISILSGGERARVALAKLLIDPGNVLLMDEPTNHLDLESSESLAQSLQTFDGTLVFVSHNRSFVRQLATQIWNVEGGTVEVYPGTLDEYLAHHAGASTGESTTDTRDRVVPAATSDATPQDGTRNRKRRKAEKRDDATRRLSRGKKLGPLKQQALDLEGRIDVLETRQRQRNLDLSNVEIYDDAPRRDRLLLDYQADATTLRELTEAWEMVQLEIAALEDAM